MGILSKKEKPEQAPRLAKRSLNKKSKLKIGRAIVEKRERLETASERAAAHKKGKRQRVLRIVGVTLAFLAVFGLIFVLVNSLSRQETTETVDAGAESYKPTIDIIDEATSQQKISERMKNYIGQVENDFRDLGYMPLKAVIPAGAIREVDFYLSGWSGRIKMTIDRDTAVSVEDADRMLRYLQGIGVSEFEYIDVRIEGKGYWK